MSDRKKISIGDTSEIEGTTCVLVKDKTIQRCRECCLYAWDCTEVMAKGCRGDDNAEGVDAHWELCEQPPKPADTTTYHVSAIRAYAVDGHEMIIHVEDVDGWSVRLAVPLDIAMDIPRMALGAVRSEFKKGKETK